MTIDIYTQTADKRAIDKISGATKLNLNPITIKPTEKINVIRPVFELSYDNSVFSANYVKCTFNGGKVLYYYIDNIAINTAQRIELTCYIDVRQSYGNTFKNCPAVITRAEMLKQPTLYSDSKLPVYPNRNNITSIVMPETSNSFSGDGEYCYLLTVIGGEPTA